MKIILNNNSLLKVLRPFNDVGFVPTMGSIHEGHLSLIEKSNRTCKKTIVSIFVTVSYTHLTLPTTPYV